MPSTTNDPYLDKTESWNQTREAPFTINEFKTKSSQKLLTFTSHHLPKAISHQKKKQKKPYISKATTKSILLWVTYRSLSKPSKYLIFILEENESVRTFDRKRKLLKQVKHLENFRNYKICVAIIEVKVLCKEERLKKELQIPELVLMEVTDVDNLQSYPVTWCR